MDDKDWEKKLTPEQFKVLRQCGTEPAFSGKYWDHHEKGKYLCAACNQELFSSDVKFDSGTGWPSFTSPIGKDKVDEKIDYSHGMERKEVACSRCGGHLGHVFPDGPQGTRFCINSAALDFKKK